MRLGDLDALKEEIVKLCKRINANNGITIPTLAFTRIIDNAPTVEVTKPQSYVMGFCDGLKAQTYEKPPMFERPQGDIRWTDKLSVTSSGDIIDFEGRLVGHINLEDMKGGAEHE